MAKYVPPHLRNRQATEEVPGTTSAGEGLGSGGAYVPPHLRGGGSGGNSSLAERLREKENSGGSRPTREPRTSAFDQKGGSCEGDWYNRRDGRRNNGWGDPGEYTIFGDRRNRHEAGIDFDEYDKIPVRVSGEDCDIAPIQLFSDAALSRSLAKNLERCGYERPTPVQKYSIPIVCSGRDVMACAQTGSGKTCAFMVPAIECLLRSGPPPTPNEQRYRRASMPCVLVMAPTRELASQIYEEGRKFSFDTGIRCSCVYGGADLREQRSELSRGCDALVATPGRLHDMYDRGYVTLSFVQFLILDEADRMLDMGFEPQVRKLVEQTDMGENALHARQSMMFSATFPKEVQMMAMDFMQDYVFITVGRVGSASELVDQQVVYAEERDKCSTLEDVLQDHLPRDGLALIFVETKRGADVLERDLWDRGLKPTTIHGDRSQDERERALHAFKTKRTPLLIATDVASRGLDIPNVNLVVNYDMPKAIDDYVHRIGRTGRAGNRGTAVAFVNESLSGSLLRDLLDALWDSKQEPPEWFEELCRRCRGGYSGNRSSGKGSRKGKGGGHRFGGRDMRSEFGNETRSQGREKGTSRRGGGGGGGSGSRGGDCDW